MPATPTRDFSILDRHLEELPADSPFMSWEEISSQRPGAEDRDVGDFGLDDEADEIDDTDVDAIPVEDLMISQDPSNSAGHFHPLSFKKLGNTLNIEAFAPKNSRRTVRIASGSTTMGRRQGSPPPSSTRGRGRPPGSGRL
jgi:hypothetical protein